MKNCTDDDEEDTIILCEHWRKSQEDIYIYWSSLKKCFIIWLWEDNLLIYYDEEMKYYFYYWIIDALAGIESQRASKCTSYPRAESERGQAGIYG